MGDTTGISWAHRTFNPWIGCVKISPACRLCYAERDTSRWGNHLWGTKADRRVTTPAYWRKPHQWNKIAADSGEVCRVFSASLADVFEDRPDLVDPRQRLFDLIEQTPALTWMLLTKRPQNIEAMADRWAGGWPGNTWCGVSAETQRFAVERLPHLEKVPAVVRFVSSGPTLGPVDLTPWINNIQWVITEGESGVSRHVRPSHPAWYRTLRDQCTAAGVAFQHKQNGEFAAPGQLAEPMPAPNRTMTFPDGQVMWRVGRKHAGRLLDGQVWDEFPAVVGRG